MKSLTICQPFAHLIVEPDSNPDFKRAENRTWYWAHRGPLAIHAGKSRKYLAPDHNRPGFDCYGVEIAKLPFGALVGVVNMVGCIRPDPVSVEMFIDEQNRAGHKGRFDWLRGHQHLEGPWCHIYDLQVKRLELPIPYMGKQGPFSVSDDLLALAMNPKIKEVRREIETGNYDPTGNKETEACVRLDRELVAGGKA